MFKRLKLGHKMVLLRAELGLLAHLAQPAAVHFKKFGFRKKSNPLAMVDNRNKP
jgi:hypothetical protein